MAVNELWRVLQDELGELERLPNAGVPVAAVRTEIDRMSGYHRGKLIQTFRAALGIDVSRMLLETPIRLFLEERITENVNLIKTIPRRYHDSLRARVQQEFDRAPFNQQALRGMLRAEYRSTGWNLRRLTRDQTNKVSGQLTQVRQKQLGVKEFVWSTAGDERVRPEHVQRGGITYPWDNPPGGEIPGEPILCRCVAVPVVQDSDLGRLAGGPG